MSDLNDEILAYLDKHSSLDSIEYAQANNIDHQRVIGSIKSLQSQLEGLINVEEIKKKELRLTDEGKYIATNGSHEAILFNAIPDTGITQVELESKFQGESKEYYKVGFSKAMANKWIEVDKKSQNGPRISRKIASINDEVQLILKKVEALTLNESDDKQLSDVKKRKLVAEVIINGSRVTKGPNFTTHLVKPETDLTADMIANNSWKEKKFKEYNLDALGVLPKSGHLHPLLKVRAEFRKIFIEMGFSEMPTNNYIESSFWNFDTLFQPQQHPARDAHDTFFISNPALSTKFDMEYLERVKTMHSVGGQGSQGYKYDWKLEEAQKNILRTHTTAVSARMLYKLAKQPEFKPAKYFSIDKVFRNENLDATHLAEFHQIEGLVADRYLTLGDLIGVINEFFKKLGITQLRFKPAYNPYTEPSLEIFAFHNGLKKWVEIGNSGVFRPEMLLPMGLPPDVSVIAWGLSLERPTMIKYGINNIRDLVGHKVDLQLVSTNPICRLNK